MSTAAVTGGAGVLGAAVDTRWHVCCRLCRTGDHAAAGCEYKDTKCNCVRCEDRTQETFGNPHPDDWRPAE